MKFLIGSTILITFALINLGGFVHNTGSSLACPDWPLCFGQVMPKMEGGVLIEHSHRLLGALVGFLSILISFFSYKKYGQSRIFKFSLFGLALVVFQGVLGGLTVIYKLPTIVSTAHLATSMIVFGVFIYLYHLVQTSETAKALAADFADAESKTESFESKGTWNKSILKLVSFGLLFIYGQMILGASMRHLGLGSVCGTGWENAFACFDLVLFEKSWFPNSFPAALHMVHRYFAYFIAIFVIYFGFVGYRSIKTFEKKVPFQNALKIKLVLLPIIIVLQVKLGLLAVATSLGVGATTLHLTGAALLFALTWKILLELSYLKKHGVFENQSYDKLVDYFSTMKPRLSGLVIFTAGIGIYLAGEPVTFTKVLGSLFSITLLVGGACSLNCWMERDIDKRMARTADRPMAAGRIGPLFGFSASAIICMIAVILIFSWVNALTAILGVVAMITYLLMYTPAKQRTAYAVFLGAIPGALPPLMGQTAVTGDIQPIGLILFGILFLWQLPHFLAISIMHKKDYGDAGIIVFPNTIGDKRTALRMFSYAILLVGVAYLPIYLNITQSSMYTIVTAVLGVFFCLYAFKGLKITNENMVTTWARKFFFSTLVYLPVQLGILVVVFNN